MHLTYLVMLTRPECDVQPLRTQKRPEGLSEGQFEVKTRSFTKKSVATVRLLRGAKKDWIHHGFNPGGHLLGGDTVGGLKPSARGSKNGPGRGRRQQVRIDTGCQPMMGKAFSEHILDDGDDGALERYLSQLTRATCGFSDVVADAEGNGAQCSIAVGKSDAAALDQVAESHACHGLQQRILVRIVQVKGGSVQRGLVSDLLDRNVFELLFHQ